MIGIGIIPTAAPASMPAPGADAADAAGLATDGEAFDAALAQSLATVERVVVRGTIGDGSAASPTEWLLAHLFGGSPDTAPAVETIAVDGVALDLEAEAADEAADAAGAAGDIAGEEAAAAAVVIVAADVPAVPAPVADVAAPAPAPGAGAKPSAPDTPGHAATAAVQPHAGGAAMAPAVDLDAAPAGTAGQADADAAAALDAADRPAPDATAFADVRRQPTAGANHPVAHAPTGSAPPAPAAPVVVDATRRTADVTGTAQVEVPVQQAAAQAGPVASDAAVSSARPQAVRPDTIAPSVDVMAPAASAGAPAHAAAAAPVAIPAEAVATAQMAPQPGSTVERASGDSAGGADPPFAGESARSADDGGLFGGDQQPSQGRPSHDFARFAAALAQVAPKADEARSASPAVAAVTGVAAPGAPVAAVAPTAAAAPAAPAETPAADTVARLVQAMRIGVRQGAWEATVRLNPEHLGDVTIALRVDRNTVSAVVNAEAAGVRQWLESQEQAVRNGMAEHGLQLERFVVQRDGQRRDAQPQEQEPRRRQPQRHAAQTAERFEIVV